MNALDTLVELSDQMELEHAEETRTSPGGRVAPSASEERIESKPARFTPKEKRAGFVHPAQLPNGKQVILLKTLL
jgi:hypothetical protein